MNDASESSLVEGIASERWRLHAGFASEDAHEGVRALLGERPPASGHR